MANIVVPASAAPLIATWGSPELCYFMCVVAFAFLGIGFFLFLIVTVMLIARLVYHPLPHAHLASPLAVLQSLRYWIRETPAFVIEGRVRVVG